jgi:prepilin-type N-terminal cleavage/methylation domain-containing protein
MKARFSRQIRVSPKLEKGMSLIELMIAMLVLATGLGAITILLAGSIASNNRSSKDSTATMLAQMVVEQISAQHVYSTATITITDCAGTAWTVGTTPGASPNGTGANLLSTGLIDQTQTYANVPAGYAMKYVDCATGGPQMVYDVRWNVMSDSTNPSTRLITAAARLLDANAGQLGNQFFALPVNLRGIGGP